MTATVLTFTRDWQGPARERDTWIDDMLPEIERRINDRAALHRIVDGTYDDPPGAGIGLLRWVLFGDLATLTLALAAWWLL
jgi:hypothetical protein